MLIGFFQTIVGVLCIFAAALDFQGHHAVLGGAMVLCAILNLTAGFFRFVKG